MSSNAGIISGSSSGGDGGGGLPPPLRRHQRLRRPRRELARNPVASQSSEASLEEARKFFTANPRFRFIKMLPLGSTAHPMVFSEHEVKNHGNGNKKDSGIGKVTGGGKRKGKWRGKRAANPNNRTGGGGGGGDDKDDKSDDRGRMIRRIVVKSAINSSSNADLAREQRWMDILAGAPHIVQSLNLGLDYRALRRRLVVTQYVAHGDISDLVGRLRADSARDVRVPNRVLWRFFLCLLRAVTAMAFPPLSINPNAASDSTFYAPERVPKGVREKKVDPTLMVHGDLHQGNILIDNIHRFDKDGEHDFTPMLKLHDFGESEMTDQDDDAGIWTGVAENIGEVAAAIMLLAEKMPQDQYRKGATYQQPDNADGTPGELVDTRANAEWAQAHVSPDLRNLIYECLDDEYNERPDLDELLERCEDAVRNLTPDDFDYDPQQRHFEHDDAVRQFVKRFIFDADADDGNVVGKLRVRTRSFPSRADRQKDGTKGRERRLSGSVP